MACGSGAALLLVMISSYMISAQDSDILTVNYPRRSISSRPGSAVKLNCSVEYEVGACGLVQGAWQRVNETHREPIDPSRSFTEVSEVALKDGRIRRREVMTEILRLTPSDTGTYQCIALCERTKDTPAAHFITLTVERQDGH